MATKKQFIKDLLECIYCGSVDIKNTSNYAKGKIFVTLDYSNISNPKNMIIQGYTNRSFYDILNTDDYRENLHWSENSEDINSLLTESADEILASLPGYILITGTMILPKYISKKSGKINTYRPDFMYKYTCYSKDIIVHLCNALRSDKLINVQHEMKTLYDLDISLSQISKLKTKFKINKIKDYYYD